MRTYLSVSFLLVAALSRGQQYHVTQLGYLPGGYFAEANGINSSGQVVGYDYIESNGAQIARAFLWSNGVLSDIGTPGGSSAAAYGINDAGQIVGIGATATGMTVGFICSGGNFQDIGGLNLG